MGQKRRSEPEIIFRSAENVLPEKFRSPESALTLSGISSARFSESGKSAKVHRCDNPKCNGNYQWIRYDSSCDRNKSKT